MKCSILWERIYLKEKWCRKIDILSTTAADLKYVTLLTSYIYYILCTSHRGEIGQRLGLALGKCKQQTGKHQMWQFPIFLNKNIFWEVLEGWSKSKYCSSNPQL